MPAESRVSWHVYIVRCADRTLYTGVAKDLPARIAAHNDGRGAKYTRQRLPVKLVYSEAAADRARRAAARARDQAAAARGEARALPQLMTEKRRPSGRMIAFKK